MRFERIRFCGRGGRTEPEILIFPPATRSNQGK
jgi:hypothetical protein